MFGVYEKYAGASPVTTSVAELAVSGEAHSALVVISKRAAASTGNTATVHVLDIGRGVRVNMHGVQCKQPTRCRFPIWLGTFWREVEMFFALSVFFRLCARAKHHAEEQPLLLLLTKQKIDSSN